MLDAVRLRFTLSMLWPALRVRWPGFHLLPRPPIFHYFTKGHPLRSLAILIAVVLAASSQAQVQVQISDVKIVTETVIVSTETVRTVTDTGQVIGDPVITEERGDPVIDAGAPAKLMEIKTDAVNVQLRVTDISRLPVEFEIIGDNQFLLNTPGKQWVDLTVVDFDKNIFFLNTYVVEVEGATPGPDPPGPAQQPAPPGHPCP